MILRLSVEQCYNEFESALRYSILSWNPEAQINEEALRGFLQSYTACFLDLCENTQALESGLGKSDARMTFLNLLADGSSVLSDGGTQITSGRSVNPNAAPIRVWEHESAIPSSAWYFEPPGQRWLEAASKRKPSVYMGRMISKSDKVFAAFCLPLTLLFNNPAPLLSDLFIQGNIPPADLTEYGVRVIVILVGYCLLAAGKFLLKSGLDSDEHCVYIRAWEIDAAHKEVTQNRIRDKMPEPGTSCELPFGRMFKCDYREDGCCIFKERVDDEGLRVILEHIHKKGYVYPVEEEGRYRVVTQNDLGEGLSRWLEQQIRTIAT